jgi:hypothetical protein
MVYLLTAIGLTPGGSSTVHIYTQTIHRTTQSTQTTYRTTQFTNQEECGPCPVFARYTLAFALQLRKINMQPKTTVCRNFSRLQTANVAYFQRQIQLSGFSPHPDVSLSQLNRISAVLLYVQHSKHTVSPLQVTALQCLQYINQ